MDCIVSVHYKESDFELGRCDVHRGKRHVDETKDLEYKITIEVEEPSVTDFPDETTQALSTQSPTTRSSTLQSYSTTRPSTTKSIDKPLTSSLDSMLPGDKNLNDANGAVITNMFLGILLCLSMF